MSQASNEQGSPQPIDPALLWARAATMLRAPGHPMNGFDLFLGTLLANPEPDGEMRTLIGHFGLTARDLLPIDSPVLTVENLRAAAATVEPDDPVAQEDGVIDVIAATRQSNRAPTLADLVGQLLTTKTAFRDSLEDTLEQLGVSVTNLARDYQSILVSRNPQTSMAAELGRMLTANFALTPASLPVFSSDAVDPKADFIGLGASADAFAYLISSRALAPPLAIGLFGHWGSGKSFLMAKIRHRITQLGELADAKNADGKKTVAPQMWSRISHIKFNAWEYVETNLWAALLHRIFEELTPGVRQTLRDRRRAAADTQLGATARRVRATELNLAALQGAEQQHVALVQEWQRRADEVAHTSAMIRDSLIAHDLESAARVRLRDMLVAVGNEKLGVDVVDAIDSLRESAVETRTSPWLQAKFWTVKRVLYVVAAAAVVPAVAFVMEQLSAPFLTSLMVSLAPLLPLAATALKLAATFAADQRAALEETERRVNQQLAAAAASVENDLATASGRLEQTRRTLAEARTAAAAAREQRTRMEHERESLTVGNVLADFLADRRTSDDYRGQLGLISRVNQDLTDLTDLTREFNREDRPSKGGPPNRIVLYVDDLDRCPPKKVLEVLEAVHLLLSFELFVVVVAVDTRWLRSSLHEALPSLQPSSESDSMPSAMDYVEKIFQIPFWVEELDDDARRRLIRGLLLSSVLSPSTQGVGGDSHALVVGRREEELIRSTLSAFGSGLNLDARQLALTAEELTFIESLSPLIGGTPRQVKRFVNICQLLLAMRPQLADARHQSTERIAACFMAALHEGCPRLANRVVRTYFKSPAEAASLRAALDLLGTGELTADRRRLAKWLKEQHGSVGGPEPFDQSPMRVLTARFDMIRRLRFEHDPADTPLPTHESEQTQIAPGRNQ